MTGCLSKIIGLSLILLGLWAALLNHGFGSMIDPSLPDAQWWLNYLSNTWQGFIFSIAMLFVGGWLLFGLPKHWSVKEWTPIEEPEHFLYIDRQKLI